MKTLGGSGSGGCVVGGVVVEVAIPVEVAEVADRLVAEVVTVLRPHCPASC